MKILLTYSSKTGNTKLLCTKVFEAVQGLAEIDFLTVKEVTNFTNYDLVIVGFWIDKGTANREARKFVEKLQNTKLAFLATLGASPDSVHGQKTVKKLFNLPHKSNKYFGVSLARGKVDEKLTKRIKLLPLPKTIKDKMYDASINSRPPNEEEIQKAINFIKGIVENDAKC